MAWRSDRNQPHNPESLDAGAPEISILATMTAHPGRDTQVADLAAEDRLIVALDMDDEADAVRLIDELGDDVSFYKIGYLRLFDRGLSLVDELVSERGKKVFLDLKFFDVPQTVAGNIKRAAEIGVSFATVHGNGQNIAAARAAVDESDSALKILAVTILTSLSRADVSDLYGIDQPVEETVVKMASYLLERGCDGVIASPEEARRLRDELEPRVLIVTPGVRLSSDATDDHERLGTPRRSIADGADYLVVGRPIYQSPNPAEAARAYVAAIRDGLNDRIT